jgi:hypothetical protein
MTSRNDVATSKSSTAWVSDPLEAAEDELIGRLHGNKQPINGFKFLLLDTPSIVACFLADHGSIAWRAGLTIIASDLDGQGEPVKVSNLLGAKTHMAYYMSYIPAYAQRRLWLSTR